jgi:shikimate dehydrogenase
MSVLAGIAPNVRAGLIGDPVDHSLSPLIHEAAYRALGLDWRYAAFRVQEGRVAAALDEARRSGMRGLSVTTPLKAAAWRLCEDCSETVSRVGAANTVVFGETTRAENTDGVGLIDDLLSSFGFVAYGQACAVIGAGAAARAIVTALADEGASEILIVNRTRARAESAATLAGKRGLVGEKESLAESALVVQAASVYGEQDSAVLAEHLRPGQLVVDIVYRATATPFASAAAGRGAKVRNGIGLLVHQAARQVALFTGLTPPIDEMWQAVGGQGVATVAGN